jgi:hypothetical protein
MELQLGLSFNQHLADVIVARLQDEPKSQPLRSIYLAADQTIGR